jgi:endo-1,4-beta-xylanase
MRFSSSTGLNHPTLIASISAAIMLSFSSLVVAATAVLGALAVPRELLRRQNLNGTAGTQQGTHDGYFYLLWSDGGSTIQFSLGSGGSYSTSWSTPEGGGGNWIGGKGWNPGTSNRYDRVPGYIWLRDRC